MAKRERKEKNANISAAISIKVSIGVINMHRFSVKVAENNKALAGKKDIKPANIDNYIKQELYINCEYANDSNAYISEDNKILIPIDSILKTMGGIYKYYSSDDIVTTIINDKKLILKLGERKIKFGGKQIQLSSPPVSANNHIYIPSEFTEYIEGVKVYAYPEKKTVFINYYPGNDKKLADMVKVLRIVGGGRPDSIIFQEKKCFGQVWNPKRML